MALSVSTKSWIERNLGEAVKNAWPPGSRRRTRSVRLALENLPECPPNLPEHELAALLEEHGFRQHEQPPPENQGLWAIANLTPTVVLLWAQEREQAVRQIGATLRARPGCPRDLTDDKIVELLDSASAMLAADGLEKVERTIDAAREIIGQPKASVLISEIRLILQAHHLQLVHGTVSEQLLQRELQIDRNQAQRIISILKEGNVLT